MFVTQRGPQGPAGEPGDSVDLRESAGRSRHVCGGGAWARSVQRLQHTVPVLEGPRAPQREGEARVQEALL